MTNFHYFMPNTVKRWPFWPEIPFFSFLTANSRICRYFRLTTSKKSSPRSLLPCNEGAYIPAILADITTACQAKHSSHYTTAPWIYWFHMHKCIFVFYVSFSECITKNIISNIFNLFLYPKSAILCQILTINCHNL